MAKQSREEPREKRSDSADRIALAGIAIPLLFGAFSPTKSIYMVLPVMVLAFLLVRPWVVNLGWVNEAKWRKVLAGGVSLALIMTYGYFTIPAPAVHVKEETPDLQSPIPNEKRVFVNVDIVNRGDDATWGFVVAKEFRPIPATESDTESELLRLKSDALQLAKRGGLYTMRLPSQEEAEFSIDSGPLSSDQWSAFTSRVDNLYFFAVMLTQANGRTKDVQVCGVEEYGSAVGSCPAGLVDN